MGNGGHRVTGGGPKADAATLRWQFNCMPCMAHLEKAAYQVLGPPRPA